MITHVGPVLQAGAATNMIIEAIKAGNQNVIIQDRHGYLRILVPERCVLSRKLVEQVSGAPFQLPADLEMIMSSFKGRLTISSEEAVWESN